MKKQFVQNLDQDKNKVEFLMFLFLRLLMVVVSLVWLTRVSYAPAETRVENQFLKSKLSTIIKSVSIPRLNK